MDRIVVHLRVHSTCISWISLLYKLFEHVESHQIENWNHICWVVLQLSIKLWAKLKNMLAIHIKSILLCLSNLFELLNVKRLLQVSIIAINLILCTEIHDIIIHRKHEKREELLQFRGDIVCVDVGSPKHLSVTGHFTSPGTDHVGHQVCLRDVGCILILSWIHWSGRSHARLKNIRILALV